MKNFMKTDAKMSTRILDCLGCKYGSRAEEERVINESVAKADDVIKGVLDRLCSKIEEKM